MENLDVLIGHLRRLPNETEWLEFKHNNYNPDTIGEDISALANSVTLAEKSYAYMIWGVDNNTHEIVGTEYNQFSKLIGNQELESWLRVLLSKNAEFTFHSLKIEDRDIVVLVIYRAVNQTVMFKKTDYIRVGSYTKKLSEYPTIQAQLWDKLRSVRFEEQLAMQNLNADEALSMVDYSVYFDLKKESHPSSLKGIMHFMIEEEIIMRQDNGLYSITNMGAILFAKKLSDFPRISRKAVRVVQYEGINRLSMLRDNTIGKGYIAGFEELIKHIEALVPTRESIHGALREKETAYPLLAIRETVANALIHQDLSVVGTSPVVELFSNRIETTNPGKPLIDILRIIDNPPRSRNEKIASLMRRLRICEELGTGWDKITISCEIAHLPAPRIDLYEQNTKVTLFSETPFSSISPENKLWACYLHACVKYVEGDELTNSSLRTRFGLKETSAGSISRLIRDAVDAKLIKSLDPKTAPRYMKYIPNWA
jgi:predicted HTH transcriptional regulator